MRENGVLPGLDVHWEYDDPMVIESRFRALLPTVESGADPAPLTELLSQIARAQALQWRFRTALTTLDEAERLLTPDLYRANVRVLLERGRVFNYAGRPHRARPYFLQAWELGVERALDFYAVDAAHMLGIAESPERQLAWHFRALRLAHSSHQPRTHLWRGPLYNNIGWTYHQLGQYSNALAYFERALQWRRAQGQAREVSRATWAVARCLRSLGRVVDALAMQEELLRQATGSNDPARYESFIEEEIGESLLTLGRGMDAVPHFARAYELLSRRRWIVQHEPERLNRLRELAGAKPLTGS